MIQFDLRIYFRGVETKLPRDYVGSWGWNSFIGKTDLISKAAVGKQTKKHPTSVRGDLDGNAPKGYH